MIRYLRLYGYFLRFAFSSAMQFRFDFWFRMVMDALYYVIAILTYKTFYLHTPTIGGFNEPQAMVFVGATVLVDALAMAFYTNGIWWIPNFVNKGDLDYYLVRPVSSLFFICFREFSVSSFVNVLMAAGILAHGLYVYPEPIETWKLFYGSFLVLNGAFLMFILRVLFVSPSFWTNSGQGLHAIFFYLRESMERPDKIFYGWVRAILLTALPFALMSSFPTHVFFENFSLLRFLHVVAVTAAFSMVLGVVWHRGLRAYSSASS